MKFLSLLAVLSFAMIVASQVQAQQVVPEGCFKDFSGKTSCPPLGGELVVTLSGQAVCGKGRCVRDLFGKVTCSALPGGQIMQEVNGKIMCAGSCEEASASNCQEIK